MPLELDEATLRHLYVDDYCTIHDIALRFQVSQRTIRTALLRWDIPRRKRGPIRDRPVSETVRATIRDTVNARGVPGAAATWGMSREMIYAILGEQPRMRGRDRRVDDQAVRQAYDSGTPVAAIAAHWSCSPRTIYRSLSRMRIRSAAAAAGQSDESDSIVGDPAAVQR